jgi:cell division topological specificity factor
MPEFIDRILGREPAKKTGTVAKERLQFILVHDRINLPPERMEEMKKEILAVIAKYVSVDSDNVEIALEKRDRNSALVAEIPFIKAYEEVEFEDSDDVRGTRGILGDDDDDAEPSEGESPQNHAQPPIDELVSSKPAPDVPESSDASAQPLDEPAPAAEKPKPNNTPKRKR